MGSQPYRGLCTLLPCFLRYQREDTLGRLISSLYQSVSGLPLYQSHRRLRRSSQRQTQPIRHVFRVPAHSSAQSGRPWWAKSHLGALFR
ncbi:Uncharacterised protein [Vibrio cholerae]|uniref:Uncharacterized protein n=1 Tax=Vibrio cholerae TaxID=666 RepID=A0A655ZTF8_VIBCL|nr:Uncharacterised protein [Vibrio cholerae]CSB47168.1 Uncharacterised protein [Vibrio cholerae]CSB60217.1 Uncharacterised protein [Vibrio cholerae]CSC00526.1 Uncharacterised protein [Vibrio cholerae]CSC03773.1 Uncharacterised protein [Vibrio cholerae]